MLELPMHATSEDVGRAAVGIVAGVGDELVIEGELGRRIQRIAVVGLENLLQAVVRQLSVADQDAESASAFRKAMWALSMPLSTTPAMPMVSSSPAP